MVLAAYVRLLLTGGPSGLSSHIFPVVFALFSAGFLAISSFCSCSGPGTLCEEDRILVFARGVVVFIAAEEDDEVGTKASTESACAAFLLDKAIK